MVRVFVWGCAGVPCGVRGILCVPDGKFYENVKRVTHQQKTGVVLAKLMDKQDEFDVATQASDNYAGMAAELLSHASQDDAATAPAGAATQSQAPY